MRARQVSVHKKTTTVEASQINLDSLSCASAGIAQELSYCVSIFFLLRRFLIYYF